MRVFEPPELSTARQTPARLGPSPLWRDRSRGDVERGREAAGAVTSNLLDDAWNKLRNPLQPYVFGAPKIVPEEAPEALPLFELTPELIDAATLEERDAIINDLK